MFPIVLSISLCAFIIIVMIFGKLGEKIDNKNKRIDSILQFASEDIDEELKSPFVQRFILPSIYFVLKLFSRLFPKTKSGDTSKLEKELKYAGITLSTNEYTAARMMVMIGIMIATTIIAIFVSMETQMKLLVFIGGSILSVVIPRIYLDATIKNRQKAIRYQLPDVMDLLCVSVEAGLGFDSALLKVEEHAEGPLVEELVNVHRVIQMGRPRRDALRGLGERTNVSELKTFSGTMIQAEQLGIPIKNVLKSQSQQLRLARKQRAEEKAAKAPVKMMIPLVLFIFPVVFIILLGPSIINVMKTFGR